MNKKSYVFYSKFDKLIYEKINIEGAIKDFKIFRSTLSEKRVRKELSRKIEVLENRLLELNRVFSILHISI